MARHSSPMTGSRRIIRTVASLWFAALLLVLLLVAMACATVFESTRGSQQALAFFYRSWWFQMLLGLLGVNVAGALVVRYPFSRRQIGFVITHSAILVTLAGTLVTKYLGVDGQVGIAEGETVRHFSVPEPTLTVANRDDQSRSTTGLDAGVFAGFRSVEDTGGPISSLGQLQIEVQRYLPDSTVSERMTNDNPHGQLAVEVSLSPSGRDHPIWVSAGETLGVGPLTVTLRAVQDAAELARLLEEELSGEEEAGGVVKVAYRGSAFEIPLADCTDEQVPLGETGYAIRVLRYLPHATVGPNNKLTNASDQPVNPAIEVELNGPEGAEKLLAFARFPDFMSMHGGEHTKDLKVTFVAPGATASTTPIEILEGPDAMLHVRFRHGGGGLATREVSVGEAIESPWSGLKFAVLRRFDHARLVRGVVPVEPVRETRVPAVFVRLSAGDDTKRLWLQKYRPPARPVPVNGIPYDLVFRDKQIPLGFDMTLDRFRIGYYPGTRRPRSYESHVTVVDAETGRTQSRVISMNNPTKHGGYSLYQSSYRDDGPRPVSFLSVSRDPGQAVVFAGYIAVMAGMVVVLITRIGERRKVGRGSAGGEAQMRDRVDDKHPAMDTQKSTADLQTYPQGGAKHRDSEPVAAPQE